MRDEGLLEFGQLWRRPVHEGADGKAQAGLLIALETRHIQTQVSCIVEQKISHPYYFFCCIKNKFLFVLLSLVVSGS